MPNANLEKIEPDAIETVMPRATICDGRVVFER
jgi:predicted amidohydrolase YtcJ